ncbi:MAG TPA: glycosyltransferase family 9 protein [Candidatus Acidoferrum sp.]|nr:glycosyltransferase family 9 protein [Candidatus Acidoferrum sp.]
MRDTLIVRLPNWLGDTVMAVPALRALRAARPEARVALVGPWATVLVGQGLADVLVPYARAWGARLARWDEVRALGAAAAILLPNSFEAALAAWYWKAPRRVGFDTGARRMLLTDAIPMPATREHQIDEYARIVARLDVEVDDRVPRLTPPADDSPARATARRLLDDAGATASGRAVVGIHLGAAYGPSKLWPAERIAELCRALSARDEIPLLIGARDGLDAAGRITRETSVASVVGRDSPDLLPALLSELDALVCGDTGVGHLAAALGTPVVTLFGPTDPRSSAPRGAVRVITHPVACAPCFYRACPIEHPCLRGITAVQVDDALETLEVG